ncbi:MAG: TetR/AcrR family transcriptional regulator [Bacteroidota bacterium]
MNKALQTRWDILHQAFDLIYKNGYRTTSVDDIIATTKVTKGAFYYHFKNKEAMGLAVINEVMFPKMYEGMFLELKTADQPAKAIYDIFELLLMKHPLLKVELGCPAGNLTQEMSSLNTDFNAALSAMTHEWQKVIAACINNGKTKGLIKKTTNAKEVAYFVMSGYWGIRNFGKLEMSKAPYKVYLKALKSYLHSL